MNSQVSDPKKELQGVGKVYDIPNIHIILNKRFKIVDINNKGKLELEFEAGTQIIGHSFFQLIAPQDRTLVQDYIEVMQAHNQKENELTCRFLAPSGKISWFQLHIREFQDEQGETYFDLFCMNNTKLKIYEQFLNGEKQVLEAIAKNWPLKDTLNLVANIVETVSEGLCSIMLLNSDRQTMDLVAAPTLPKGYQAFLEEREVGPLAGACGASVYYKKPIMVADIETDPLWSERKENPLRHGLKACWSNPIINHKDRVIGAISIYYKVQKSPSAHDLKVIDFFSHLAELAITHSQVRQLEIQVSEEKYRMIAENTSDLIVLFNREGQLTYTSPSLQEISGIHSSTLIGMRLDHPDFPLSAQNKDKIYRAINSKQKHNFTLKIEERNGEELILEANSSPILDPLGEIENSVIVARDITERQRAKDEIERLHYQNHSILHAAGDGIYGIDRNGIMMFCNNKGADLLGYKISELVGKRIDETIQAFDQNGEPLNEKTCMIKRSMKEKRTVYNDTDIFHHKNGQRFPVEYIASPIIEKGQVTGTVVTFRDITERKREEEQRLKKETEFRTQQKVIQELSLTVNEIAFDDAINKITERGADVLKVERASVWLYSKEPEGYFCQDLFNRKAQVHEARPFFPISTVRDYVESIKSERVLTYTSNDPRVAQFHSNLQPRYLDSLMVAPLSSGKRLNGLVAIALKEEDNRSWGYDEQNFATAIADLINLLLEREERLKAEELLRKTEKLSIVGQLAAGVAHEIRNPLTSLKGFLQLLTDRDPNSEHRPFYDIMLDEIDRIHFISGELLFLAKPQAKKFEKVNLKDLSEQVLRLFQTEANLHNIQFEFKSSLNNEKAAFFEGDPNQIKQVLVNTIKNGIEAMSDGGVINVSLEEKCAQALQLTIEDHGKGISKDRLEKLGEPFYTTKEKGTGLGLMVSYRIIEAHKGTIEVTSEVGKGTSVAIYLPKAVMD